jgi:asparagine synthase (glutamine-hydrolysing)
VSSYWAISGIDGASVRRVAPSRAVDLVDTALRMAVDSASVADVSVGAYLSGGVDSSLITAMAASARPESPVATFSAVFDDARVDEGPHARRVSALLGTAHHEVTVSPADFEALWAKLTWQRDAPLSEPADIAVFQLARLASHRVKVVLSGEGSDELFAGYPKYRAAAWAALAGYVPSAVRRPLCRGLDRVLPESARRARVGLGVLSAVSQEERLNAWFAPFTSDERRSLLGQVHGPGATNVAGPARAAPVRVRDLVGHMLEADCRGWLTDNLLERGDRMSMAASVELRPPFLDHRLVELAFSLPTEVKLRRNVGKWVVKEVARRYLPAEIVDRPKVGFRVPLDSWFRTGLRSMAWDLLLSPGSFVTSAFDPVAVRKILDSHDRGRRNEDMRTWTLLSLEIWHDVFFKDPAPASGDNRAVAGPRR